MTFNNKMIIALFFSLMILVIVIQDLKWKSEEKELTVIKKYVDNCEPQKQVCNIELGGLNVRILFDENVFYLKPFNVTVWTAGNTDVESVYVDFKMKNMNMGVNRFLLAGIGTENKKQRWQGKALLPICVARRADWISELEIIINTKKYILAFPVIVKKAPN